MSLKLRKYDENYLDLDRREFFILVLLLFYIILLGIFPQFFLNYYYADIKLLLLKN